MAIVLGVDPGFAAFGWAVVDLTATGETLLDVGVIRTKKADAKSGVLATEDNIVRTRLIYRELENLYERYKFRAIASESMVQIRGQSQSAFKVFLGWGALGAFSEVHQLPLVQVSPQKLKKLVGGAGTKISKEDIQTRVLEKFPGAPLDGFYAGSPKADHEHGFDAVAVVLACRDSEVFRMARG